MRLFQKSYKGFPFVFSCGEPLVYSLMRLHFEEIMNKIYSVVDIIEDDFGCEGIPEEAEAFVTVIIADESGQNQSIRMPDEIAYERDIVCGARVNVDDDGFLKRI